MVNYIQGQSLQKKTAPARDELQLTLYHCYIIIARYMEIYVSDVSVLCSEGGKENV